MLCTCGAFWKGRSTKNARKWFCDGHLKNTFIRYGTSILITSMGVSFIENVRDKIFYLFFLEIHISILEFSMKILGRTDLEWRGCQHIYQKTLFSWVKSFCFSWVLFLSIGLFVAHAFYMQWHTAESIKTLVAIAIAICHLFSMHTNLSTSELRRIVDAITTHYKHTDHRHSNINPVDWPLRPVYTSFSL